MTLYQELVAAGEKVDSYESDLYVRATEENKERIRARGLKYAMFVSQVDGELWYDVFGAYDPFWEARRENRVPRAGGHADTSPGSGG